MPYAPRSKGIRRRYKSANEVEDLVCVGVGTASTGKSRRTRKRNYPPEQHGKTRKAKVSQFGAQLHEKQKLIFHYSIREEQLHRFVRKAKSLQPKNWIEALKAAILFCGRGCASARANYVFRC